jgi:hypothetical protein
MAGLMHEDSEPKASNGGIQTEEFSDDDCVVEDIRDMRLWN